MATIVSRAELGKLADELHAAGKTIVSTTGCFDLLHVGHLRVLKAAKSLGDVLVVGINSDQSIKKLKGSSRPITPEHERAEIMAALKCVDYVTIFGEDTPIEFFKILKPNIQVKGADFNNNPVSSQEKAVVESFGGRMQTIDMMPDHSTTLIIAKMEQTNS